jgi:hypothetical protein
MGALARARIATSLGARLLALAAVYDGMDREEAARVAYAFAFFLRRRIAARPKRPVPNRANVPGSGTLPTNVQLPGVGQVTTAPTAATVRGLDSGTPELEKVERSVTL